MTNNFILKKRVYSSKARIRLSKSLDEISKFSASANFDSPIWTLRKERLESVIRGSDSVLSSQWCNDSTFDIGEFFGSRIHRVMDIDC